MDRTFHHRFSVGSFCGIILFAAVAFWLFWQKWAIPGLLAALVCVVFIERLLHSEYVFRNDLLIVCNGRFSRRKEIPLTDIVGYRPVSTTFGLTRFLLLALRGDRLLMVQPANEKAFVKCLAERKQQIKRKG